jgi:flavin-dependent dehydrogenase
MRGGYGWLFPKSDHISVGVGGWQTAGAHVRNALETYTRSFGWEPSDLRNVRGHRLPLQQRGMVVAKGGAALIGDAAGLVDPLLGEGMYGAVYSGLAVARAVAAYLDGSAPDLLSYQRDVDGNLAPNLARAHVLATVLNTWPGPLNWAAMRSEAVWDRMQQLVSERVTVCGRTRSPSPLLTALGPLAAMVRRVSTHQLGPR